ncbi:hypothetical protein FJZ26_00770 [Candidatus Parvarchaeota archaeon]|nr:hypothetical protein [Candidatus Parvarchaeota archaeon]
MGNETGKSAIFDYFGLAISVVVIALDAVIAKGNSALTMLALVGTLLCSFLVRIARQQYVKKLSYLVLGFGSFVLAGSMIGGSLGLQLSIVPFLVFAFAAAIGYLIGYSDSYENGLIFAAGSLVALPIGSGPLDFGSRIDIFIIGTFSLLGAAVVPIYLLAKIEGVKKIFYRVPRVAVASGLLVAFVFFLQALMAAMQIGFENCAAYKSCYADLGMLFLEAGWLGFISMSVAMALVLVIHEVGLMIFGYRREVTDMGVVYTSTGQADMEDERKDDPYAATIRKINLFAKNCPTMNEIEKAAKLASFREELRHLGSKYITPSKQEAEKLLAKAAKIADGKN